MESVVQWNEKDCVEALLRAKEDELDLEHDCVVHPWNLVNCRGEPEWAGSEAEMLLEIDVQNGLSQKKAPEKLHKMHMQCQEFPLEVFCGHIFQEEQMQKWKKQWVDGKKECAIVRAMMAPSTDVD